MNEMRKTYCGTHEYFAPEMLKKKDGYGVEMDRWALGILTFELVVGVTPFRSKDMNEIKKKIIAGEYTVPSFMSKECEDFIRLLLVQDPKERPEYEILKDHAFIQKRAKLWVEPSFLNK